MKSLKLHWFVTGFILMCLSLPACASEPVLDYDQVTPGTIASTAQTNLYSLTANAGDFLNFTVVTTASTSSTLGPCIQLFNPANTAIASAGGNYHQVVEMNGVGITASGKYTVSIKDCANTATGTYVLFVQKTNDPVGSVPLPFAQVQTGTIGSEALSNAYTFSAQANDVVSFTVVTTKSTSSTLGPCIQLYNSTGTPELASAGGNYHQDVEMNQVQLATSGVYNVFIKDCADTATGNYSIFMQKTNDPIGSVPILYDQVQTGNIGSVAQTNAYTLIGSMNDVLNFTVVAKGGTSLGPCIILYNSTGTPALDSAGGNNNQNVQMNGYKIPANGTYNVLIKDCADTGAGDYTLSTSCLGVCPLPAPTLASISPNSALAGGKAFTLTVNGTNFVNVESNSVVLWNGSDPPTTWVSTNQMTAAIPAKDIKIAGIFPVTVSTPAPGGGISPPVDFTVYNPPPTLTSISPTFITAGGAAFTITLTGSGFVQGSAVQWNGIKLATTYVSATELTAQVPASDIGCAGTASVTVFNPTPGGGTSQPQTFTIDNPMPATTSLSPTSITATSAAFTLTVNGSNFVSCASGSVVMWNATSLTPTSVTPTQLQVTVPAADIAAAGTASLTVFNPTPGGGTSSPALTFTINPTIPKTTSLSPSSAIVGSPAFTLTVKGSNFINGANASYINWNGNHCNAAPCTTKYISATKLTASVPASYILAAGTALVTVTNPVQGGLTSSPALTFTIDNPVPAVTTLSPINAAAGGPAFTLTVNGSSFVNGSVVNWNGNPCSGTPCSTAWVSASQLTAAIPAAYIAAAGNFPITVTNPGPGGGTSKNAPVFAVVNPKPVLTSISPASIIAGGSGFTLTATGSNFVGTSVVRWNGHPLVTTYVNSTELQAAVPASDSLDGTVKVTVFNPAPGGGVSALKTLTVDNPVPVVTSLSPASIAAGSASFTLTVNGFNFNEGAAIQWNGAALATVFVSDTQLQATIPAAAVATSGTAQVTVANPAPSPAPSTAATFTIN